jgi:ABC-type nitrate/sulfonate/bicarbonate transport system ATPase subunit
MSFVEAREISFTFPGRPPLFERFSLSIEKGECVGLTGPSGRGKSTLAHLLAGHLRPSSGRIFLNGDDITGRPNRRVLVVPQENDLFPWMKVERQIGFAIPKFDRSRVEELIKLTRLENRGGAYPHELSGGMKKRLSLARALAADPAFLIFDETFSALDFELRRELFADLKGIWRKTGATILVISHDPRDLSEVVEREVRLESRAT